MHVMLFVAFNVRCNYLRYFLDNQKNKDTIIFEYIATELLEL